MSDFVFDPFPNKVNENKISTKNAFELPLIEHMDDIVDSFMGGKKVRHSAASAVK